MSKEFWLSWQKQVIREEYKDIIPARDNAQKQVDKTLKETLKEVLITNTTDEEFEKFFSRSGNDENV